MTNKEAIKRIQDIITYTGLTIPTSLNDIEALEMAIKALEEERPQGEWLFTEIDENYHVYGQCSICKERNRIGKACRSCGAKMVTYTGKDRDTKGGKE